MKAYIDTDLGGKHRRLVKLRQENIIHHAILFCYMDVTLSKLGYRY
jgi:hypothetical protein